MLLFSFSFHYTWAWPREEAEWLAVERGNVTARTQQDVKFRLKEKVTDTGRWQQELGEELETNKRQTKSLKKSLGQLRKALAMTDAPMRVNSECQRFRRSRIGIDKVSDSVDSLLVVEVDGIRGFQQQMKLLLEKMVRQAEASGEAQRMLQGDLRNKKLAKEIDKLCEGLTNRCVVLSTMCCVVSSLY